MRGLSGGCRGRSGYLIIRNDEDESAENGGSRGCYGAVSYTMLEINYSSGQRERVDVDAQRQYKDLEIVKLSL